MEEQQLESLKYPTGKYNPPQNITGEHINDWINSIEAFPQKCKQLTEKLSSEELNWRYRPDGWKIKQVVHHCADSHVNAYTRFKLALTEEIPAIRPYKENLWAELPDGLRDDISDSLTILEAIHHRWVFILKSMSEKDLERTFYHPQHDATWEIKRLVGTYAWHCNHHLAHIQQALQHQGKFD